MVRGGGGILAALLVAGLAVASAQFTKGKNCFPTCARAACPALLFYRLLFSGR